jgi:hypothetical protein
VAIAVAFVIASPHLLWLVNNDFLPFRYAEARAAPSRGVFDHAWHPLQFLLYQLGFMLPALGATLSACVAARLHWSDPGVFTIAAPLPRSRRPTAALSLTGRGTIASGTSALAILRFVDRADGAFRVARALRAPTAIWAIVFFGFAAAFVVSYAIKPQYDGRYRAVFFPGDRLGAELSARFQH